jgi:hypothetical protein
MKKDGRDWNISIIQWMWWMTWMDEMLHGFSPSHMFSHINHNHISYLNQINSLGFSIRVWGFLPPSAIPYGTVDGADAIHPAFYHLPSTPSSSSLSCSVCRACSRLSVRSCASLAAVLLIFISLAVRFCICNLVSFKGGIQQHAQTHTHSQSNRWGMEGRRSEVGKRKLFERIRAKRAHIGRHTK